MRPRDPRATGAGAPLLKEVVPRAARNPAVGRRRNSDRKAHGRRRPRRTPSRGRHGTVTPHCDLCMMPFALGTHEFVGNVCLGPRTTRAARRVFGRVTDIVVRAPIVSSGVFLRSGASIYTGDDAPRITRPTRGVSAIALWSTHAHVPVAIDFARSAGSFSSAAWASVCARRAPPASARPSI